MMRLAYNHNQPSGSSVWTVNHNLNSLHICVDVIVDYGVKETVFPYQIIRVNENTIQIDFTTPVTGHCRVIS